MMCELVEAEKDVNSLQPHCSRGIDDNTTSGKVKGVLHR